MTEATEYTRTEVVDRELLNRHSLMKLDVGYVLRKIAAACFNP